MPTIERITWPEELRRIGDQNVQTIGEYDRQQLHAAAAHVERLEARLRERGDDGAETA